MIRSNGSICNSGLCRPGGFSITDRALQFCNFKQDAKLVDVGCGLGATVQYVKQKYGLEICGIDKDQEILMHSEAYKESELLLAADAEKLPFHDGEFDGVLFECSLSKMGNSDLVLAECARVLNSQGYLIISDFYARGEPAKLSGLLGRVDTKETLIKQLEQKHFSVVLFEDYTNSLQSMWGQMIFEYGMDALYENLCTDGIKMNAIKCGYCLIVAKIME
jgi:arsenite methyltransferase